MDLRLPRWSLAAWYHVRARVARQPVVERRIANPHCSVSIVPGLRACEAIRAFTAIRYLASEAPRLPLPGCSSKRCTCKYVHHSDRRARTRRVLDAPQASMPYCGIERRSSPGRRATDA